MAHRPLGVQARSGTRRHRRDVVGVCRAHVGDASLVSDWNDWGFICFHDALGDVPDQSCFERRQVTEVVARFQQIRSEQTARVWTPDEVEEPVIRAPLRLFGSLRWSLWWGLLRSVFIIF